MNRRRCRRAADVLGLAGLDVFRAVAEALAHVHREALVRNLADDTVQAVAPPRVRFDPEQTDGRTFGEGFNKRIGRQRPRANR